MVGLNLVHTVVKCRICGVGALLLCCSYLSSVHPVQTTQALQQPETPTSKLNNASINKA